MDVRPKSSSLESNEPQAENSWIPTTPAKPGIIEQQSICTETQQFQTFKANWLNKVGQISQQTQVCQGSCLESGKLVDFQQESQVQNVANNCDQINSRNMAFDNWEAAVAAKSQACGDMLRIYNKISMENADKWSNISFKSLLALADAAAADNQAASNAQSNCCSPVLSSQVEPRLQRAPCTPNRVTVDSSNLSFDLNSPPQTRIDADSSAGILVSQFAPLTPDLTKRANKEESDKPKLCMDDESAKETDKQNQVTITIELNEKQNKCQPELVENQSCATMSVLQENHEPGMGTNQETEIKTPQQKPRRRKHRPKVVVEGQPKRTPNPKTKKPAGSEVSTSAKRKYVRKNRASSPGDTAMEVRTGADLEAKPPGSEEIPKTKRRYIRRKGISQPTTPMEKESTPGETVEGRTGTDLEAKPPTSEEIPKTKRRYIRRKGITQPTTPLEEGTSGTTGSKAVQTTRRSCRRSLNFNSESQVAGESSTYQPSSDLGAKSHAYDQLQSTMNIGQGVAITVEKTEVSIAYDLTQSMNHALEDYLKESLAPWDSTSLKTDQQHDKMIDGHPNECTRGKCQIVFSDATHDKGANILDTITSDDQGTRSPSIPNCSSSACLTQETQARGLKRQRALYTTDESNYCRINATEALCNSLQVYLDFPPANGHNNKTPSMHFPTIYKKKRSEKVCKLTTSSLLPAECNDPFRQVVTSETGLQMLATHYDDRSDSTKILTADGAQNEQNNLKCLSTMGSTERLTKKRSKGATRVRDVASLLEICRQLPNSSTKAMAPSGVLHEVQILQGTPTCMDALVADTRARLTTKKRSKRNLTGPPPALVPKSFHPVDAMVEQFNRLDLDAESNMFANQEHNALIAYCHGYHGQNAIVVYQGDRTMIPFDGSLDHIRRRRPRPKVDLDDETTRVWKLLLENINNDGIDGTDEEKVKWWQEERKVFEGRADSFIARMSIVQGDRRFSPWKGSVVDSVVGVFLTQNVSDHLSSSAFISMAARFPLKSRSNHAPSCEEGTNEEPEVLNPDDSIEWHDKVSYQHTSDQDFMTLQDTRYREEVITNRDFFGNASEGIKSADNSKSGSSDSLAYGPNMCSEPDISRLHIQNNKQVTSLSGDQREDVVSSQNSVVSPQNSVDSIGQIINKTEPCSQSSSGAEVTDGYCASTTSFVKLLQMAGTTMLHGVYDQESRSYDMERPTKSEERASNLQINGGDQETRNFDPFQNSTFPDTFKENELSTTEQSGLSEECAAGASLQNIMPISFEEVQKFSIENCNVCDNDQRLAEGLETELDSDLQNQRNNYNERRVPNASTFLEGALDASESTSMIDKTRNPEAKAVESTLSDSNNLMGTDHGVNPNTSKAKRGRNRKEKVNTFDWHSLRKQALANGKRERPANTMDSVDWEAVRCAEVDEIAQTIKERGMNFMLAERIKDFLNRLVREHGSIDLEWLRDVPPDKAKEYLLSIRGLGLKSVECVRLLTLHHLAFPVDTNVGRIAVRLGWVPLQPLPESLQLHLLELYPVLESIQKYLWPRLCKLDQRKLYELHYHMITFGKVFCTKNRPNCNSCPMRGECRHFASAYASARLALPAPEEKSIVIATESKEATRNPAENINYLQLRQPEANQQFEAQLEATNFEPIIEEPATPEPIIEEPFTPEPEQTQVPEIDIEDMFPEDSDGIPTIDLNIEALNQNLQNIIRDNVELQESEISKALVVLTPEAASIPMPKLKNISRLRTEHRVYELPDSHQLLKGLEKREPDDPCSYLLAIWTPGETVNSIQPPERRCSAQALGYLCDEETCFSCNSIRESRSQTVRGTFLIPCRTAMRGSFPLNGTYFQVNEVFADHETSLNPIDVPRHWLWNLPRRTVFFGTSIPSIFKGLQDTEIRYCFWKGHVCVRGFDRSTRAPRPLIARLHFPASKMAKKRGGTDES